MDFIQGAQGQPTTAVDEVDDRLFLALLTRLVELAADVGRWPAAAVAMLFPCVVHATLHRAAMPSTAAFLARWGLAWWMVFLDSTPHWSQLGCCLTYTLSPYLLQGSLLK